MRENHYTLLFIIILIPFIAANIYKANMAHNIVIEKIQIEKKLARASDAAVKQITNNEYGESVFNMETAALWYFEELNKAFAVRSFEEAQLLQLYVPIIALIEENYYTILYCTINEENGNKIITRTFSERYNYGYKDEEFYKEFEKRFNYYINEHNRIAKEYGIKHKYNTKFADTGLFDKKIDLPTLIVWFEGYPYSVEGIFYKNAFISGAMLKKNEGLFITYDNGINVYHNGLCKTDKDNAIMYGKTRVECEKLGAVYCEKCFDY